MSVITSVAAYGLGQGENTSEMNVLVQVITLLYVILQSCTHNNSSQVPVYVLIFANVERCPHFVLQ